jgi:lantibiotic modifying enzyme
MSSDDPFLDAAAAIGRRIVRDAVWDDGRCNWVGAVMDPKDAWQARYRALEPNLYDGTAGVGLFLAELGALTGDAEFRRAALGAMRQAAARAPSHRRDGFHVGSLGIAWAVATAAALLDADELHERARMLPAVAAPPPSGCPDVLLGAAGSAIARLALAEMLDDAALVEDAVATGEELLSRASITRHGWSWADPRRRYRHHLCGLSHGAGGIGWALLELFLATGDDRFRDGAEGAFAYERSWLHEDSGTWPDLRFGGERRGKAPSAPPLTAGSWCYGEAGIAVVRLRAIDVLGPGRYEGELGLALEATRRQVVAALPYEIEDLTLCHGAAGAAEALLCGAAALGGRCDEAAELGSVALERFAATGARWPCGALGETSPALFRGLSGIGWWLLRLHDPTIPSPLSVPLRLTGVAAEA